MKNRPVNIDEYLVTLPEDARATLEEVRRMISAAAPGAVESIGYAMPAFKYKGRPLAYFAASRNHCALYGMPTEIEAFRKELESYDTSKGTIRFPMGKPLPETLVQGLVQARMDAIDAAEDARKGRKSRPDA